MRSRTVLLLSLMAALSCTAAAEELWLGPKMPAKPLPGGEPVPLVPRTQGDTVEDPFLVTGIPFTAAGSTCAFNDDYDAVCPYFDSTAPDGVYRYDCLAGVVVSIDLCASSYDTKVYVFENTVGNVIACNEDYCARQSYLGQVELVAGASYFIVVDGYGTSCGDYALEIGETPPCALECPPGAMPEGEPDCYDDYADSYNSGCACQPDPLFQNLEPSVDPIVICGTTGVWMAGSSLYRDPDWFEIHLTEPSQICLAGDAEVPMWFMIVDGREGCSGSYTVAYAALGACSPVSDLCYACDDGTWWLQATPIAWDVMFECGSVYWLEISGYTLPPAGVPEEDPYTGSTWGRIKGLFR